MQDKSYTPLRNDFNTLLAHIFPTGLSPEQTDTLGMFFFAGAAAAVGTLKDSPELLDTVIDELSDATDVWSPNVTKVS